MPIEYLKAGLVRTVVCLCCAQGVVKLTLGIIVYCKLCRQGHAVLLYRPGIPPSLDLEQLIVDYKKGGEKETSDDDNDS